MAKNRKEIKTKIIEVDPKKIKLLEVNARYMPPERFARLVENIKSDGCLTSVPLVYKKGRDLVCISGNHRTMAAVKAGIKTISVQQITSKIADDEFIAKQLSHNSLVGLDNQQILKKLWDEMDSIESKLYSGLDKSDIEVNIPTVPTLNIGLDFEQVTIVFLPQEKDAVSETLEEIKKRGILSDENWIETLESYETVKKAVIEISEKEKIHNYATVIAIMSDYAMKYMEEHKTQVK